MTPDNPNPRKRLSELLQVPENNRTDSQWEEIHQLELDVMTQPQNNPIYRGQHDVNMKKTRVTYNRGWLRKKPVQRNRKG